MNDPVNQFNAWYRYAMDKLGMRDSSMGGLKTGVDAPVMFARDMLGRYGEGSSAAERPDFFGGDRSYGGDGGYGDRRNAMMAYAEPERFNEPMPRRRPMEDPLRPQIRNYIARMLGGG